MPKLKELYGIVSNSPWVMGSAAGLDPKVAKVLQDAFRKVIDDPGLLKALEPAGLSD